MTGYFKRTTNKQGRYLIDYFFQGHRRAASPAIKMGSITARVAWANVGLR